MYNLTHLCTNFVLVFVRFNRELWISYFFFCIIKGVIKSLFNEKGLFMVLNSYELINTMSFWYDVHHDHPWQIPTTFNYFVPSCQFWTAACSLIIIAWVTTGRFIIACDTETASTDLMEHFIILDGVTSYWICPAYTPKVMHYYTRIRILKLFKELVWKY